MLDATDKTALSNFEKLNVWFFFVVYSGRGRPPRASHLHWTRMQYLILYFTKVSHSFVEASSFKALKHVSFEKSRAILESYGNFVP